METGDTYYDEKGVQHRYVKPMVAGSKCQKCKGSGVLAFTVRVHLLGTYHMVTKDLGSSEYNLANECDGCAGTGHATTYYLGGCV